MPKYIPIELPIEVTSSQSDVCNFSLWEGRKIKADFIIPSDPEHLFRVSFDKVEIVRLLDEMAISTEMDTQDIGLIPNNLAYEVVGSAFWDQQSEALKLTCPKLRHYRFITGWTCIDVLTELAPYFDVIKISGA